MLNSWHKALILIVVFPCLALANINRPPEQPDFPPLSLINPLLRAINSGDTKVIQKFILNNYASEYLEYAPVKELVNELLTIHKLHGELTFHSILQRSGQDQIKVLLHSSKTQMWYSTTVILDYEAPKIYQFEFTVGSTPKGQQKTAPVTVENAVKILNSNLDILTKMNLFSGAVLIAKQDKVLYKAAFGEANKRFNIANTVKTRFGIGAMTEMFNAVAIMQLVEKNKLSLNDKLSKFVDESWLPKSLSHQVELQHLLSHSSGLEPFPFGSFVNVADKKFIELDDYKPLIKDRLLVFKPGTQIKYSNTGLHLLGVVIEAATGENYFNYIKEHIYKIAGMTNSGTFDMEQSGANFATRYFKDIDTDWQALQNPGITGPSGGSFSTVDDLHRFALALNKHKLLTRKTTQILFEPRFPYFPGSYGFGFLIQDNEQDTIVGNTGGMPGNSANLEIYQHQGFVVVLLTNYHGIGATVTGYALKKIRHLLKRIH